MYEGRTVDFGAMDDRRQLEGEKNGQWT